MMSRTLCSRKFAVSVGDRAAVRTRAVRNPFLTSIGVPHPKHLAWQESVGCGDPTAPGKMHLKWCIRIVKTRRSFDLLALRYEEAEWTHCPELVEGSAAHFDGQAMPSQAVGYPNVSHMLVRTR